MANMQFESRIKLWWTNIAGWNIPISNRKWNSPKGPCSIAIFSLPRVYRACSFSVRAYLSNISSIDWTLLHLYPEVEGSWLSSWRPFEHVLFMKLVYGNQDKTSLFNESWINSSSTSKRSIHIYIHTFLTSFIKLDPTNQLVNHTTNQPSSSFIQQPPNLPDIGCTCGFL